MDRILKQLLADFLESQEMKSIDIGTDFERFVNYSVISHEYNRSFEVDTITVGEGDDTGIDGIAIIVNGQIVESIEEIDFFVQTNNSLEATYIFIQAKASSSFEASEMNTFVFGVKDFFSETPRLRRNADIQTYAELSDYLLSKATHFRDNPACKLFYVTTGTWANDQNLKAVISSAEDDLKSLNLFSSMKFNPLGANQISTYYRETKNAISAAFTFSEKVTLPEIPGISEAYYGILPFSEFKKLLVDDNGNVRSIFYDNVRDFQGNENPINQTIAGTLSSESPHLFTVLNNGVTVVASSLKTSGNRLLVNDYQVVNGCQTSNVLLGFLGQSGLEELKIPLRLIITDNDEVKNKITIATNSQTAIKKEQLQAMTDFQKGLEHYYNTYQGEGRIYYERRSKQYQSNSAVVKARIITMQTQIKAFGSMFLDIPDLVTSYFGTVVRQYIEGDRPSIFNPVHKYIPYYTAGLASYRLDNLFHSRQIDPKYRRVKYFILMLFRKLVQDADLPQNRMNSEKWSNQYCEPIIDVLNDSEQLLLYMKRATEIFDVSGVDLTDKQALKHVSTTEKLKKASREYQRRQNIRTAL
jgi:hypothetical protein